MGYQGPFLTIVPLAVHSRSALLCVPVRQFMMMAPSAALFLKAIEHSLWAALVALEEIHDFP